MRLFRLADPLFALERAWTRRRARVPARGLTLISAGGLGDTVLLAVVLERFLRLAREAEPVTVVLRRDAARMAFLFPKDIRVVAVDFARLRQIGYRRRILAEMAALHPRLLIHTDYLRHPDLDEALVAAADAERAVAMVARPSAKHQARLDANRRLYAQLIESGPPRTDKLTRWAAFADALAGLPAAGPPLALLPAAARPPAQTLPVPTAILQPFSAVAAKQSPPQLWELIINALPPGWAVRLAGHPSDLERNPAFRPLLDLPRVSFEDAPFERLAGIIGGARMVVSVDTACMHLATVLGAPTLCLASAAYVGEIVPYAPAVTPANLHVLHADMECAGCLGACSKPLIEGMYPCVAALDPDEVLAAVADLLARGV